MTAENGDPIIELRRTLGKMEIVLSAIDEAIVWTDDRGDIQWCNAAFDRLAGQPHIQILGKPMEAMLPLKERGVDLPEKAQPVHRLLESKDTVSGYYELFKEDGRRFLRVSGQLVGFFDGRRSTVFVIDDLTEEKELEGVKLQGKALEAAANGICITDRDGKVIWTNPAFNDLTGYTLEEVYGGTLSILKSGHHDEDFYQRLWQTIQAGEVWRGETVNRRKDGRLYTEDQMITPVRDPAGHVSHYIAIKQDISARKAAEEELARYQDELEMRVEERTRKLEAAQKELLARAVEAGRAQWAAMMLHNIGNAVTPAGTYIEKLRNPNASTALGYLRKCYEDLMQHRDRLQTYVSDDPRGGQVLAYMGELIAALEDEFRQDRQQLDKLASAMDYIGDILTLQQTYVSGARENREHIALNRLLKDAVQMQSAMLEKRGIQLEMHLDEAVPSLSIDKSRLIQVVVNLLKNSAEAIEERFRGVAGDPRKVIRVASFTLPQGLGFEVSDNGIGLPPEKIEQLFTFGRSFKGSSGIGLYYCQQFAEANRGHLTISSPGIGRGATVRVEIDTGLAASPEPPAGGTQNT